MPRAFSDYLRAFWARITNDDLEASIIGMHRSNVSETRFIKHTLPAVVVGPTYSETTVGWQVDETGVPHPTMPSAAPGDTDVNRHAILVTARPQLWNGSSWERWPSTPSVTLLASAIRAATTSSATQSNVAHTGVYVRIAVTSNPGGARTLTLDLSCSPDGGTTWLVLSTSGAQTFGGGAGDYVLHLAPGIGAAANDVDVVTAFALPRTWRITVTPSDGSNWTYSVTGLMTL